MPKPRARSAASARPAAPYHHGDLRRALIDTALAMVTEEGAWNFTLREVARRAGVSQAAPYNHFEDKSALLAEVAALGFQSLRQTMDAAARGQPRSGRQALAGVGAAYVRFGVEHPAHYRLMFGAELADKARHPTLQAASDATFAVLTGVLERGQASGQVRRGAVRDQALAAWSLVHGLTTLLIDQRLSFLGVSTGEAERHARLAGMTLFAGLSAKTASHRSRG
ncbi:MAG: TetR/AcrR family transcriptional regulator [Deltaproteobacteria bacterium]|nr:MAG: TetR/AcrR family transcriptional regulator [Deltaproteobacteria bacterium]